MTLRLPSLAAAAVDSRGFLSTAWVAFFRALTSNPGAAVSIAPQNGTVSFTAPSSGNVLVEGGSGVALTLTRGRTMFAVPAGFVPVFQGDVVAVTYGAAPTVTFFPGVL